MATTVVSILVVVFDVIIVSLIALHGYKSLNLGLLNFDVLLLFGYSC